MRFSAWIPLLAACGSSAVPAPPGPGPAGGTPPPDAAPVARGPAPKGPEPGSAGDVLGRVLALGREPAIPPVFAGVRPGASAGDATRAWKGATELPHPDEPAVTLGLAVERDVVEALVIEFEQVGAVARLEEAWGPPAARAFHAGAACWIVPATRLKACYVESIDRHAIELGTYVPLVEALAPASRRDLAELATFVGKPRRDVERAYPDFVELADPENPDRHRLEVRFPSTEYTADVGADRVAFWLDRQGAVAVVAVKYGANDPGLRAELVERVRAAARDLPVHVTIVEDEPVDVVVELDREQALR